MHRESSPFPALYVRSVGGKDERMQRAVKDESVRTLVKNLCPPTEHLAADGYLYHYDGLSALLLPVVTELATTVAKVVVFRLDERAEGPRAFSLEFGGVAYAGEEQPPGTPRYVALSSSSGKNRVVLRPTGESYSGGTKIIIGDLKILADDEDDGFWGAIGDFFEGVVDAIGDFFDWLWEKIKGLAAELWQEIKDCTLKIWPTDEDEDGVPDGARFRKEIPF